MALQFLPSPYRGMNTKVPFYAVPLEQCTDLLNLIPTDRGVVCRAGAQRMDAGPFGTGMVDSLMVLTKQDGTETLFVGANSKLYKRVSGADTDLTGVLTVTNNQWQHIELNERLLIMNGTDAMVTLTATPTAAASGFTGPGGADALLIQGTLFKSRPFFVEKNSFSYWYGEEDAVTGALTEVDLTSEFHLGGYLMWAASWQSTGDENEALLVFLSSQGEALVYAGLYPDASDWRLIGRAILPRPLGRRSYLNYSSDLLILSEDGVLSFGAIFANPQQRPSLFSLSDDIYPSFRELAKSYKSAYGWQLLEDKLGQLLIVNCPAVTGTPSAYTPGLSADHKQFVMDKRTGGWCRFGGLPARCLAYYADTVVFGTYAGTIGELDPFDKTEANVHDGGNIRGGAIAGLPYWSWRTQFHNLKSPLKKIVHSFETYGNWSSQNDYGVVIKAQGAFSDSSNLASISNLTVVGISDSNWNQRHDAGLDGKWFQFEFTNYGLTVDTAPENDDLEIYGVEVQYSISEDGEI
jgi:hypothetical protein